MQLNKNIKSIFESIVDIQLSVQDTVMPTWRQSRIDPVIAYQLELAEAIAQLGRTEVSEWWKKADFNKEQYILELTDALVFAILAQGKEDDPEDIVESLCNTMPLLYTQGELDNVEEKAVYLSETILFDNRFPENSYSRLFNLLLAECESFESIYSWYLGKSVLNKFRKENGYKDGTYVKVWEDGQEDNVWLAKIADNIDFEVTPESREDLEHHIHKTLGEYYQTLVLDKQEN